MLCACMLTGSTFDGIGSDRRPGDMAEGASLTTTRTLAVLRSPTVGKVRHTEVRANEKNGVLGVLDAARREVQSKFHGFPFGVGE
jgi:hypothetical protein